MAMSYARPDPASPAAVADASFSTSRRGFDQGEVRDFLRMVAAELGRLQERERFLERELREAHSNPDLSAVDMDDAALTRLLGEETARVLGTAREAASEIRSKAEQAGAQMLMEASDEAARVREEADVEATRRRADAAADAESELEMAKQQGREMVNEARAYRERVLSELARRRELAREQIEQLIHGRDRLAQAFERARVVAVDVVSELETLGQPNEYVNLAPTTGPVPVMVANPQPPAAVAVGEVAASDEDAGQAPTGVVADAADEPEAEVDESDVVPAEGEAGPTDDAATTEDGSEPAAEDRAESEPADDESAQESVDDEAAVEDDADVVDDDDVADDDRDEVVVDLFARLRADAARRGAEDAPEPRSTATATLVGDLDDGASAGSEDDRAGADLRSDAGDGAADAGGDDEPNPFRRRDAELTPLIVASAKKLKRALADEQNAVLETLRHDEAVADVDALIPAVDDHVARYVDAARDELLAAANAGARAGTSGSVTKLRKASGEAAVGAAAAVVGEWLVGPLRERLERGVADGGGDNAAVSRRVRSLYREWKTQHIDEQLDDVLRMAFGRGAFEAVKTGTPLVWSIDAEHPACPDCDDNGLAGPVAAGEEFPTGHLHAPAHPGCRCLLLQPDS